MGAAAGGEAQGLRAGAGAAAIRAPDGVPLAGYGARGPGNRSAGVAAPVEARALVVEGRGGSPRVALVALDVLIVTPGLRAAVGERARALEPDLLVVAATHTHSGPGGYVDDALAEAVILGWHDPAARAALVEAAGHALEDAAAGLQPARLGAAEARAPDLVRNRRRPGGPRDPRVPVLRVDAADGAPIATLFALAAHPTVLGPAGRHLHPDYPGAARRTVEAARSGVAVFLAGPLGDQEPRPPGDGGPPPDPQDVDAQRDAARRLGEALGVRVLAAAGSAPTVPGPVAAREQLWELPPVDVRGACAGWVGAPLLHLAARRFLPRRAPLAAARLGPLALLASPFELGVEVAATLRERWERGGGRGPLLIAAHAGDWLGYLLAPADYERGGYEACLAFHGRDAAPRFTGAAAQLLDALPPPAP